MVIYALERESVCAQIDTPALAMVDWGRYTPVARWTLVAQS
jgi:hypothetical protein